MRLPNTIRARLAGTDHGEGPGRSFVPQRRPGSYPDQDDECGQSERRVHPQRLVWVENGDDCRVGHEAEDRAGLEGDVPKA